MPLDPVGVCTGVRVHKVNLVVNLQVRIPLRCEAVVCLPAVANDGRARLDILFDDRQESSRHSVIHRNHKEVT